LHFKSLSLCKYLAVGQFIVLEMGFWNWQYFTSEGCVADFLKLSFQQLKLKIAVHIHNMT
jgi:hypothetical protein